MACNCKHMEREIAEYKSQIEAFRELFVRRMTVDSETHDRRRKDYNQALFWYDEDRDEYRPIWNEIDLDMVMTCFENALKDWRRTFCDVDNCTRK